MLRADDKSAKMHWYNALRNRTCKCLLRRPCSKLKSFWDCKRRQTHTFLRFIETYGFEMQFSVAFLQPMSYYLILKCKILQLYLSCIFTGEKTLHICHYHQQWWLEKLGKFLLKSFDNNNTIEIDDLYEQYAHVNASFWQVFLQISEHFPNLSLNLSSDKIRNLFIACHETFSSHPEKYSRISSGKKVTLKKEAENAMTDLNLFLFSLCASKKKLLFETKWMIEIFFVHVPSHSLINGCKRPLNHTKKTPRHSAIKQIAEWNYSANFFFTKRLKFSKFHCYKYFILKIRVK
jgi:hypothetical protein